MYVSGVCAYCGGELGVERDHILSWRRGGMEEEQNYAIACSRCNKRKLDITPEEWRLYVGKPLQDDAPESALNKWPESPYPPTSPISEHGLRYINNARRQCGMKPLSVVEVPGIKLVFRYNGGYTTETRFVGSRAKARKHLAHLLLNDNIGAPIGIDMTPTLVKVPTETPWGDIYGILPIQPQNTEGTPLTGS